VKTSTEHPALFTAVTIEDTLNFFREVKLEEAQAIEEKKDKLLSRWKTIIEKNHQKKDL